VSENIDLVVKPLRAGRQRLEKCRRALTLHYSVNRDADVTNDSDRQRGKWVLGDSTIIIN